MPANFREGLWDTHFKQFFFIVYVRNSLTLLLHKNDDIDSFLLLFQLYLTISRRMRREYRRIATETKSRWLFADIHVAWGD